MEQPNINSGDDYAHVVMNVIIENEKLLPKAEQMPIDLVTCLSQLVHERANQYYEEYIIGKRDVYLFSDVDLVEMFNKAGETYVSDMVDQLVDKDVLEVSVDEEGEFLYGLTDLGKQILDEDEKS
jgi:Pyruvate/2-oxoacid:ferredoxin oxidoreductase gamma subunit